MRQTFVADKWEFEVHDIMKTGQYGYRLDIFKNDVLVKSQAGFGSISGAEMYAKDYFLLEALGVEREEIE